MERIDKSKWFVVVSTIIGVTVLILQGINTYSNIQKNKREKEKLELDREKDAVDDKLAELQAQKTQLEIAKLNQEVPAKFRIPESQYLGQDSKFHSFSY